MSAVEVLFNNYSYLPALVALFCCLARSKHYKMSVIQVLLLFSTYVVFELAGNHLAARLTLGYWDGYRWYGVPLMVTFGIYIASKFLKNEFGVLGDLLAASVCIHHILAKVGCLLYGCCTGIIIFFTENVTAIHFPSREFEILIGSVILFFLLRFEKLQIAKGMLWEIYMIWYAIGDYVAAWFWEYPLDHAPFLLWIPLGRLWIITICIVGFVIPYFHFKKNYGRKPSARELLRAVIGKFPQKEVVKNA